MNFLSTVLIVEDDKSVADNVSYYIQTLGFRVLCASNGEEGYEQWLRNSPELIIADIEMPTLSGLDMIEKIRKHDKTCVIFVVTGHPNSEYLLHAVRLHLEDLMIKPLTSAKISSIVERFRASVSKTAKTLSKSGALVYSYTEKCLYGNNIRLPLTHLEILLLELLIENTGKVVEYATIEHLIYEETPTRNAIKSLVKKLRAKLDGCVIEGLPKLGYKLICSH
jgi:two-component system, OmpR family, response regulator VanR